MVPGRVYPARWYRSAKDAADDKGGVPGTYLVTENGRPEAQLHGRLDDDRDLFFVSDEDLPNTIWGNAFGQAVTLSGCRLRRYRSGMSSLEDLEIHARLAYEGLWLDESELLFTRIRFQVWDQDDWTEWRPVSAHWDADHASALPERIEFTQAEDLVSRYGDCEIRLCDSSTFGKPESNSRGIPYRPQTLFQLDFDEPVRIEAIFNRYILPLEFMIISSTDRESGIRSIGGTNRSWSDATGETLDPKNAWVAMRRAHTIRPANSVEPHKMLHRLKQFDFNRQIPLVMDAVNNNRYAVEQHSALISRRGFPLGDFMGRCQAVEAFDRSLHGDGSSSSRSLESRLKRLDQEVGHLIDELIGNRQ